jgi:multidrug efflux system membrane fusion protein
MQTHKVVFNLLFISAAAAALTACKPSAPQASAPSALKVSVVAPTAATVTNWDEYPGHLEAVESVDVRPRVSGYLESIHFEDGAEVKAGDLLFVIDPKPYQAEFDRARAGTLEAETRLELAKNDLRRAETLKVSKAISEEEYDTRANAVRQAEAALVAAKAGESSAQINLDYTRITAPVSGRIGRRLVTPGNLVGSGTTLLANIVTLAPIYCYFDATESAFLSYQKNAGLLQSRQMECFLTLGGQDESKAVGKVDFYDNQVDRRTGTIRLRAVFDNADRSLSPGLFATVRVPAGPPEKALLIPDTTVISDQDRKSVMVVSKANTLEMRAVKAGRAHGAMRAILDGITAEDRIIVNGMMMISPRPGTPVEIAAPAAAPSEPRQAK